LDINKLSNKKEEVSIPSREEILHVLRQEATPLSREQLQDRLGLTQVEVVEAFQKRLAAMERDGQLMPNRKGVLLLSTKLDFIAGKVSGHRDGFGFLLRDDKGPDVFLSPREMQKVLHGDRVLVRITGTDNRGRPEGTIVEVTERRTNLLVGRLVSERGVILVVPEDQRIKHDILIPPGDIMNAKAGQVVSVEILEQPSRYSQPIGRIVEVLGQVEQRVQARWRAPRDVAVVDHHRDHGRQVGRAGMGPQPALPDADRVAQLPHDDEALVLPLVLDRQDKDRGRTLALARGGESRHLDNQVRPGAP
jgi:ribonuclease R